MWILVGAGWAVGVPPLIVGAGILMAISVPLGVVAVAVVAFIEHRRRRKELSVDEAGFLRMIATSVSAGSTLRLAVRGADRQIVSPRTRRLCDAGVSMASVGRSLQSALAHNGASFAAVCSLSEITGAKLAPTLHVLADRATEIANLNRYRRIATAQARFSALVVGLAPLAVTAVLIVMRGVPGDGSTVALASMVIGASLQILGVAVVFVMASRSVL